MVFGVGRNGYTRICVVPCDDDSVLCCLYQESGCTLKTWILLDTPSHEFSSAGSTCGVFRCGFLRKLCLSMAGVRAFGVHSRTHSGEKFDHEDCMSHSRIANEFLSATGYRARPS